MTKLKHVERVVNSKTIHIYIYIYIRTFVCLPVRRTSARSQPEQTQTGQTGDLVGHDDAFPQPRVSFKSLCYIEHSKIFVWKFDEPKIPSLFWQGGAVNANAMQTA